MATKREILVTEEDSYRKPPKGFMWASDYSKRSGLVMCANYLIAAGSLSHGNQFADSLTEARRIARRTVKAGAAWAEVLRYAENGVALKKVLIASYEVEIESGSTLG